MGVLMYVPISRAGQVIDLAFEKTLPGGTVGIFDVPRLSTKQQAIAYRVAQAGGLKAYNSRYGPGMQHQYYPDDWAPREMEAVGLVDVRMLPPMLGSGGSCAFRDFFVGHKP
jgi:hypothetical protein